MSIFNQNIHLASTVEDRNFGIRGYGRAALIGGKAGVLGKAIGDHTYNKERKKGSSHKESRAKAMKKAAAWGGGSRLALDIGKVALGNYIINKGSSKKSYTIPVRQMAYRSASAAAGAAWGTKKSADKRRASE